jgi:Tol biopolymer transport system component
MRTRHAVAALLCAAAACGSATDTGPAALPAEREILFVAHATTSNVGLFTMRGDGTNVVQIAAGGRCMSGSWSPDGEYVVFADDAGWFCAQGSSRIMIARADGTEPRPLTPDFDEVSGYWEHSPFWSPAGGLIAFARTHELEEPPPELPVPGLYVIAPDGSGERQLVKGDARPLGWTEDGHVIANVAGWIFAFHPAAAGEPFPVDAPTPYRISPDGEWIVHGEVGPDGTPRIRVISSDSRVDQVIAEGWQPEWRPR